MKRKCHEVEDLFPSIKEENVSAETTTGLGYEPGSDDEQPREALQQSDSTRSQDRGREQAGQVPGQQSRPTTSKDFEHASGATEDDGDMMQEEQEGQEMNIECTGLAGKHASNQQLVTPLYNIHVAELPIAASFLHQNPLKFYQFSL